jgi:hypothetical protein
MKTNKYRGSNFRDFLQEEGGLGEVERYLEILRGFFPNPEHAAKWLSTPHPDLDGLTARQVIDEGNAEAVLIILGNAQLGIPV